MGEIILDTNNIWVDKLESGKQLSYPGEGNDIFFKIEENSFWFAHRNNIIKRILERFPFSGNFADIGGGNGFQAKFIAKNFPEKEVYLIEPGYEGCLNAKKRGLKNVFNIPFQKFDFTFNKINAAGLFDVVEHIENDVEFLKQLKQKLPENSLIYITVPAHNFLWSDIDDCWKHYRRYDKKMLHELGLKTGMQTIFTSYFFSYLPPLTFLARSLPYKIKGKRKDEDLLKNEAAQHNPSKSLLKIFDFFHHHEIKKISSVSINFGASCIAVYKT